ncbi:MAG: murein L,D-transpeptidase catalytic domain family protein [Candidatus Micrarchaeota archaeon]|nr:murein L,D-transpeptidase catalytic domain family protein [Candidatus Micrarchaeota archaeon]
MNQAMPFKKFATVLLTAAIIGCVPYHTSRHIAHHHSKHHHKYTVYSHNPKSNKKTTVMFRLKPIQPLLETQLLTVLPPIPIPPKTEQVQVKLSTVISAVQTLEKIYSSGLSKNAVSQASLATAYKSYSNAVMNGSIKKGKFIVVDLTMKSNINRLAVVDFESGKFVGAIKVMHGSGSGDIERVASVSNTINSFATPGGLLRICGVNGGEWEGWKLEGLERGNNNSRTRNILLHMLDIPLASTNETPKYLTYGCLGVNPEDAKRIGLPVVRSEMTSQVKQAWLSHGIYVYFPSGAKD